jgi:hypothetical protein
LSGLAVQARLLAGSIDIGHRKDDADLATAIAEQLEELARLKAAGQPADPPAT